MAILKNVDKVWTSPVGQPVTVGHNRTLERVEDGLFIGRLHGSPVARIECKGASGVAYVTLNDCGFLTSTTREAMRDFCKAFGIDVSVSIAGGRLSARWKLPTGTTRAKEVMPGHNLGFAGHRYL